MTHQYEISGMTCGSCVARVKSELLKLGDVQAADVQLQSPQLTLGMNKHIPTSVLQQAIQKAGNYTLTESMSVNNQPLASDAATEQTSYFPIFLIFGYIAGVSLLVQAGSGAFNTMIWMSHFMAGFFFVFSFFKLLNLKGFAEGYGTYDVIAKKFPAWGFTYPFVELGLGIAYLTGFEPLGTNIATFLVMSVSSVGVIQSLVRKTKFQCACLGTIIKLPLSKVTLVEDLLMVLMSLIMIIIIS